MKGTFVSQHHRLIQVESQPARTAVRQPVLQRVPTCSPACRAAWRLYLQPGRQCCIAAIPPARLEVWLHTYYLFIDHDSCSYLREHYPALSKDSMSILSWGRRPALCMREKRHTIFWLITTDVLNKVICKFWKILVGSDGLRPPTRANAGHDFETAEILFLLTSLT